MSQMSRHTSRIDRVAQMTAQEEIIARKKLEFIEKQKTAELAKQVAAAQANTGSTSVKHKKEKLPATIAATKPIINAEMAQIKNNFSNDGSFFENFKKITDAVRKTQPESLPRALMEDKPIEPVQETESDSQSQAIITSTECNDEANEPYNIFVETDLPNISIDAVAMCAQVPPPPPPPPEDENDMPKVNSPIPPNSSSSNENQIAPTKSIPSLMDTIIQPPDNFNMAKSFSHSGRGGYSSDSRSGSDDNFHSNGTFETHAKRSNQQDQHDKDDSNSSGNQFRSGASAASKFNSNQFSDVDQRVSGGNRSFQNRSNNNFNQFQQNKTFAERFGSNFSDSNNQNGFSPSNQTDFERQSNRSNAFQGSSNQSNRFMQNQYGNNNNNGSGSGNGNGNRYSQDLDMRDRSTPNSNQMNQFNGGPFDDRIRDDNSNNNFKRDQSISGPPPSIAPQIGPSNMFNDIDERMISDRFGSGSGPSPGIGPINDRPSSFGHSSFNIADEHLNRPMMPNQFQQPPPLQQQQQQEQQRPPLMNRFVVGNNINNIGGLKDQGPPPLNLFSQLPPQPQGINFNTPPPISQMQSQPQMAPPSLLTAAAAIATTTASQFPLQQQPPPPPLPLLLRSQLNPNSQTVHATLIGPPSTASIVQYPPPLHTIPPPMPLSLNKIPPPRELDLNAIPEPKLNLDAIKIPTEFSIMRTSTAATSRVFSDHELIPTSVNSLVEMVAENGDDYEDKLLSRKCDLHATLWCLMDRNSIAYRNYREQVLQRRHQKNVQKYEVADDDKYDPEDIYDDDDDDAVDSVVVNNDDDDDDNDDKVDGQIINNIEHKDIDERIKICPPSVNNDDSDDYDSDSAHNYETKRRNTENLKRKLNERSSYYSSDSEDAIEMEAERIKRRIDYEERQHQIKQQQHQQQLQQQQELQLQIKQQQQQQQQLKQLLHQQQQLQQQQQQQQQHQLQQQPQQHHNQETIDNESAESKRAKKKRSRWGDKIEATASTSSTSTSTSSSMPMASMPSATALSNPLATIGPKPMLTKIMRNDPALLQYARQNYGSINLTEEEWTKCEDHYKISLLYQDLVRKRNEIDRLAKSGRFKYEYDSDEDCSGGTWEHKLRTAEMEATAVWAEALNKQSEGKHHIGDFLPPEELRKFMEKYNAKQTNREPNLSDYKEYKLREDNIGFQMLQKLGWKEGQGLGSDGSGILNPVNNAQQRDGHQGLGALQTECEFGDNEYDAYRKRMMLAYRFRPNPLNNPRRAYY